MSIFPIDKLKPISGKIEGAADDASITIDLHPFNLQIYDGEKPVIIKTSLRLDSINLPTLDGTILQYQSYEFPINPNDGYIDGSIYIEHAHHPADVTRLKFGKLKSGIIDLEINLCLSFEFEGLGEYKNTPWTCTTKLHLF